MRCPFTVAYDAGNRQKSVDAGALGSAAYEYDGDGRRVRKLTCATAGPCRARTAGVVQTVFVYDAFGQLAAEYSTASASGGSLRTSRSC